MDIFIQKYGDWIQFLVKPVLAILGIIFLGYFTMWLSVNYVKQDQFSKYVEKQLTQDQFQDKQAKERFDIIQAKLETIITQQVSYTEQLKAYNQVFLGIQKQVDSLDDRLKYIERNERGVK